MIILFGPAGSGKSEQGMRIAEKYGWKWLSIGQLLRDTGDPEILATQKKGVLVDDNIALDLMSKAMNKAKKEGVEAVVDGFPRNLNQAEKLAEHKDMKLITGAIVLEVPVDELWKRIELRGREDDTKGALKKRWEIFEQNIYSILPVLEGKNVKTTTVDGVGTREEVTERIEKVLREWEVLSDADILHSDLKGKGNKEKSYGE